MRKFARLCVFCGSNSGRDPIYRSVARDLGQLLVDRDIELVYGGGSVGLMGEIADCVMAGGGRVQGVIPAGLFNEEVAHRGLTELHEVASMHERKALLYELADGFVALPGGLGTLEEVAETATWGQIGLHRKPLGLLNQNGFYDSLIRFLNHSVTEGFLRPENRALITVHPEPVPLLDAMANWRHPVDRPPVPPEAL